MNTMYDSIRTVIVTGDPWALAAMFAVGLLTALIVLRRTDRQAEAKAEAEVAGYEEAAA
jgi:hypothetical protein